MEKNSTYVEPSTMIHARSVETKPHNREVALYRKYNTKYRSKIIYRWIIFWNLTN